MGFQSAQNEVVVGERKPTLEPQKILQVLLESRRVQDIKMRAGWESANMKRLGTAEEWIESRLTLSHCLKLELTLKKRVGE